MGRRRTRCRSRCCISARTEARHAGRRRQRRGRQRGPRRPRPDARTSLEPVPPRYCSSPTTRARTTAGRVPRRQCLPATGPRPGEAPLTWSAEPRPGGAGRRRLRPRPRRAHPRSSSTRSSTGTPRTGGPPATCSTARRQPALRRRDRARRLGAVLRFGDDEHGRRPLAGEAFRAPLPHRQRHGRQRRRGLDRRTRSPPTRASQRCATRCLPAAAPSPESLEQVRRRAPAGVPHAGARGHAGRLRGGHRCATPDVQRAAATLRWTGSWNTVFLTVDRLAGAAARATRSRQALVRHVDRYRMAGPRPRVRRPARSCRSSSSCSSASASGLLPQRCPPAAARRALQPRPPRRHARPLPPRQLQLRPDDLPLADPRRGARRCPASPRPTSTSSSARARHDRQLPRRTAGWRSGGSRSRGSTTTRTSPSTACCGSICEAASEARSANAARASTAGRSTGPAPGASFREAIVDAAVEPPSPAGARRACGRATTTTSRSRSIDAFAVMADVLGFYQERIANEAFLRTATERRSVLELAALLGYEPAPGVAADAWLAFTLQEAPGAPAQSASLPVADPRRHAGAERARARTRRRRRSRPSRRSRRASSTTRSRVQTRAPQPRSPSGRRELYLAGTGHRLAPGDAILVVGAERAQLRRPARTGTCGC